MKHVETVSRDPPRPSEEPYRLLVEHLVDYAIFMLDDSGHITTWNAGAERLTGYSTSEIVGQPLCKLYPVQDAWKCGLALETARREGRLDDEGWRVRKSGSLFWASTAMTALRDSRGRLVGFGTITRDLTERRDGGIAPRE